MPFQGERRRHDHPGPAEMTVEKDQHNVPKVDSEHLEEAYKDPTAVHLSPEHREFLLDRHGTLDLNPIPSMDPADPYNWPSWKKGTNLALVAFHAFMGAFSAASIIAAFAELSEALDVSLQRASYLVSLQIAILGGAPLFWKPLANHFGRRPIFLVSLLFTCVCNVGCAKSPDYASMAACRALAAFFISPAKALGSAVVVESYFEKERARCLGVWAVMVTLGIPVGPFIFGFVTYHVGYVWIYWILAITNGCQLILYIFFGPETRYIKTDDNGSTFRRQYMSIRKIDPKPLKFIEFVRPLFLAKNIPVLLAADAYAMVFLFASVMNPVEIPELLQEKFELNAQQLGLQFLGVIIGTLLGEVMGGVMSDMWMIWRSRRIGHRPDPEFRLWLSYVGFIMAMVGTIVFLVCTEQAQPGKWTVVPLVGTAISSFGNQVVTTVLITYAVDNHPEDAGSVGVFINFVRLIWGFLGPFWFPAMFETVGVAGSAGVVVALICGVSFIPVALLHWQGWRFREAIPQN